MQADILYCNSLSGLQSLFVQRVDALARRFSNKPKAVVKLVKKRRIKLRAQKVDYVVRAMPGSPGMWSMGVFVLSSELAAEDKRCFASAFGLGKGNGEGCQPAMYDGDVRRL
jgi:hypothetical protein